MPREGLKYWMSTAFSSHIAKGRFPAIYRVWHREISWRCNKLETEMHSINRRRDPRSSVLLITLVELTVLKAAFTRDFGTVLYGTVPHRYG